MLHPLNEPFQSPTAFDILTAMMPSELRLQFSWREVHSKIRSVITFPNKGDDPLVIKAHALLEQQSEEDRKISFQSHADTILSEIEEAFLGIIRDTGYRLPIKALCSGWLIEGDSFRTRDISPILQEEEVSVSNLSVTMENLERQELIEGVPKQEGKERQYQLTPTGNRKLKRLLKKK